METPQTKSRIHGSTPFRSPRGISSGKRTLDSYRKQRLKDRRSPGFQSSVQSPYPPSLSALLSSRIDRYKRICPNLSHDLEQKVGLSPVALAFHSPKMDNQGAVEIQGTFLKSVINTQDLDDVHDMWSENHQIIQLISNLSKQYGDCPSPEIVEFTKQIEGLGKKLSNNLHQLQTSSNFRSISSEGAHHESQKIKDLQDEKEIMQRKLVMYQKQIENMNKKDVLPTESNEAISYLKTKLNQSTRKIEESQELVSMLRTALASSIQERLNLEESLKTKPNQTDLPQDLEEQIDISPNIIIPDVASEDETKEKSDIEIVSHVDQGEYDEELACEYENLLVSYKAEALKERNHEFLHQSREVNPTLNSLHLALKPIDMSKVNTMLEEEFIAPKTTNQAKRNINIEDYIGKIEQEAPLSSSIEPQPDSNPRPELDNKEPPIVHHNQPARATGLSWIMESAGLIPKQELHSAVLIF